MIQSHSIILWRKAENKDKPFEEIAKEAYRVFSLFQDLPQILRPNYLCADSRKDIVEFDWNYTNFYHKLRQGVNREGKRLFEDLGYSLSFFSCVNEQDSCAFSITAGNKIEKFYNTLIIRLPLSLNLYDEKTAETVKELFGKLVEEYQPFWGCVSNRILSQDYRRYIENNRPTTVHWINYWSEDIIRLIGMKKIQAAVRKNPLISFEKGILSTKDTAFDMENEEDIRFHNKLQKQLF